MSSLVVKRILEIVCYLAILGLLLRHRDLRSLLRALPVRYTVLLGSFLSMMLIAQIVIVGQEEFPQRHEYFFPFTRFAMFSRVDPTSAPRPFMTMHEVTGLTTSGEEVHVELSQLLPSVNPTTMHTKLDRLARAYRRAPAAEGWGGQQLASMLKAYGQLHNRKRHDQITAVRLYAHTFLHTKPTPRPVVDRVLLLQTEVPPLEW